MSLHTTHRPQVLKDVLGQGIICASLEKVIKGRRAHSFIFTGPSGTGKTTLARILAKIFAGGTLTPANMEEIDAANASGAEDARALVRRTMFRAVGVSPVKTIIVDEAHRLSAAAWTVLLKPVEEPPAHVFWAFCTTEAGKLPKAIQTRCLKYDLKPVDELLLFELVDRIANTENLSVPDEVLEAVAEGAGGSPRQALVYLEACAACKTAAEARQAMRSAAQSVEAVSLAKFLLGGRGLTWVEAMKHVKALEGLDAESIRIAVVQYLSAVLMGTKGEQKAKQLLALLEAFGESYNPADRMAPLLRSLGLALNLDGGAS